MCRYFLSDNIKFLRFKIMYKINKYGSLAVTNGSKTMPSVSVGACGGQ